MGLAGLPAPQPLRRKAIGRENQFWAKNKGVLSLCTARGCRLHLVHAFGCQSICVGLEPQGSSSGGGAHACVCDGGGFAVHDSAWRSDDLPAEDLPNALMAHTNPEGGDSLWPKLFNDLKRYARVLRPSWARRNQYARGLHGLDLFNSLLIVLEHNVPLAQVSKVLAKVVREAVVVVNNYNAALCRASLADSGRACTALLGVPSCGESKGKPESWALPGFPP
mmetsp:Transcript_11035/g.31192  ORF Transcript_11035/g.31192 Transcript_11035/m.31192 type:complete len:222 (+) Transcript_11035:967-1632(+)